MLPEIASVALEPAGRCDVQTIDPSLRERAMTFASQRGRENEIARDGRTVERDLHDLFCR